MQHLLALVVSLHLICYDWFSVRMEKSTPLTEVQMLAIKRLTAALGPKYIEFLAAQGPDVLNARVDTFMQYETTFVEQVQTQAASAMPTGFVTIPDEEVQPRSLRVDVKHYSGKEGEILSSGSVRLRWLWDLDSYHLSTSESRWLSLISMGELENGLWRVARQLT